MNKSTKIIFFGTSEFAVPALEALIKEGYGLAAVITTPDERAGRKKILTPPPVKVAAQKSGIKVLQPFKLKNNGEFVEELKMFGPDVGVVAAYGKIIPQEIINLPAHGILNIHPSLLPKYRGPSPIQYALLNGDTMTGVTIIKIDAELDHGPIIAAENLEIKNDNYPELHDKLAKLSAGLLVKVLPEYLSGKIAPLPQDDSATIFTKLIITENGRISADDKLAAAYNKIRALNPEPGTFIFIKNRRLKILEAEMPAQRNPGGEAGTLLTENGKLVLQLKDGGLILKKIQLEGKKPASGEEFVRGYPDLLSN